MEAHKAKDGHGTGMASGFEVMSIKESDISTTVEDTKEGKECSRKSGNE